MDDSLLSEKSRSIITSPLPLWIIEYAFSNSMMDVLEVLGSPPWLEGDWGSLTLKDPCSIRVVAAEVWAVIRTRDIQHFERVLEVLDVFHTLLPHLVAPIKHMKIVFGLKTLVIMWMFGDDQSITSISDKILKFFPDSLPQYHRSKHRHMKLMQNTQQDFRNFAQSLAKNPEMRKTYIRDVMEEQYGERYTTKLEERLLHYLKELDKALLQPTYIDQVLKQSRPLGGREELLQQLLTCGTSPPSLALKRLLKCALTAHTRLGNTETSKCICVAVKQSLQRQNESRSSLLDKDERTLPQKEKVYLTGKMKLLNMWLGSDNAPCVLGQECPLTAESKIIEEEKECSAIHNRCTRHGKKMKNILQECSEELRCQDGESLLVQEKCTPTSPPTPVLQTTPRSSLQDSSSTNISSSPHAGSYSNLEEEQQLVPSMFQLVPSPAAPAQSNCSPSSSQEPTFASKIISSAQETSDSLTHSIVTSSPGSSVLSFSSSPFPVNQITPSSTGHPLSPSSPAKPFSLTLTQPNNSPIESICRRPYSPPISFLTPVKSVTSSQISEQFPDHGRQAVYEGAIPESTNILGGKQRLSIETQSFLLLCKWLQPQVKLYRLNQHDYNQAQDQPSDEEEEDEDAFDVNWLYSDSESDTQDSNDPDYHPPKRLRM